MPYRLLIDAASRATGRLGWMRGAVGGLVGIALAGSIGLLIRGTDAAALPFLVAPIGASAVLIFMLPASPLAQPWPVFGGSILSCVIGLVVAHLVPDPLIGAPMSLGLAMAAMSLCRCIHPPGGACALLGPLSASLVGAHGWDAVLIPLMINLAAVVAAGWLYNNLTGHSWPHELQPLSESEPPESGGLYESQDLDAVLEEWDEVLDVSRDDLDALVRAVEQRTQQRLKAR